MKACLRIWGRSLEFGGIAVKTWSIPMAVLTIRSLPDEIHRALRVRTARHGRSTEAEAHSSLADTVMPDSGIRMGQALGSLG